jgi:hypothetical protein
MRTRQPSVVGFAFCHRVEEACSRDARRCQPVLAVEEQRANPFRDSCSDDEIGFVAGGLLNLPNIAT